MLHTCKFSKFDLSFSGKHYYAQRLPGPFQSNSLLTSEILSPTKLSLRTGLYGTERVVQTMYLAHSSSTFFSVFMCQSLIAIEVIEHRASSCHLSSYSKPLNILRERYLFIIMTEKYIKGDVVKKGKWVLLFVQPIRCTILGSIATKQ
jgi:hypothetical protein